MDGNTYELTPVKEDESAQLQQLLDQAFSKALASAIMAEFPVASIISIFMSKQASKLVTKIDTITNQAGKNPGGKRIAAKVLSKVGFIAGIINTIGWAIVGLYLVAYFALLFFLILSEM